MTDTVDLTTLFLGKATKQLTDTKSCAINCQMFFLKRENGCRNIFMTKSPRKKNAGRMVDVGSDCNKKSFTTSLRGLHVRARFFFVACVRDLYVYRIGTRSSH